MKHKYTKKQIVEAIIYWKSVLESMDVISLDEVDKFATLKLAQNQPEFSFASSFSNKQT